MSSPTVKFLVSASLVALFSAPAWAEDEEDIPPPPSVAPPSARPQYQAPLSQTTQSTYVPQSVALSGPEEITEFDHNRPIPDGYTLVHRTRKGLLIGGGVTLGVTYGISLLVAAVGEDTKSCDNYDYNTGAQSGCTNHDAAMAIPVAGPFIQIANENSAVAKLFLAGMGGAQVAGAIMLYYGMTTKKAVLVRNDIVGSLNLTPMVGAGNTGLALSGRF